MRQWVKKLVEQFEWSESDKKKEIDVDLSEERATLLYMLDTLNKHLFEVDAHPIRKVRETLDEFGKSLVDPEQKSNEKLLFRIRQFISSYRIAEFTYIQKTFDDFKGIVWDFADQLSEDIEAEKASDREVALSLDELKEAVEANSIIELKTKAREFIDFYVEAQTKKELRRTKRMSDIKKNLTTVKKQLLEANHTMNTDHLTGAFNRRSFDERLKKQKSLFDLSKVPVSLLVLDIDHFKKFNDTYGHDIGDFVLKELVTLLKSIFHRDIDFVARVGGEEFAVVLPDYAVEHAAKKAQEVLDKTRAAIYVHQDYQLKFTVSIGIAQLKENESIEEWVKRADQSLYASKHSGRNRFTVSEGDAA